MVTVRLSPHSFRQVRPAIQRLQPRWPRRSGRTPLIDEMINASSILNRTAAVIFVCSSAACSKVTAENYAKVKTGMEYKDVTGILGNPASCDDVVGFSPANGATRRAIPPSVSQVMP